MPDRTAASLQASLSGRVASKLSQLKSRAHRPMTLRAYLTVMSIVLLLPLSVISAISIVTIVRAGIETSRENLARAAADLSSDVDREIEGLLTVLQTLSTDGALLAGDYASFHARSQGALSPRNAFVILLDTNNQQLLNTRLPYGSPLPKTADPGSATIALRNNAPYITNAIVGQVSGKRVVSIMMPVRSNLGEPRILIISIDTSRFQDILARMRDSTGYSPLLIDRNARVITSATATEASAAVDRQGGDADASAAREWTDAGGQTWLEHVHRSPVTGWRAAVREPKSLIDGPMWRSLLWMLAATTIGICTAAACSIFLSRRMAESIAAIRNATDALAGGRPVAFKRPAFRETEVVMSGLTRAAALIEARSSRLRNSEARYQAALRVGRMGSWETDFVTKSRIWSPEGARLFGLERTKGTVGGANDEFLAALHPDDRHLLAEYHQRIQTSDDLDAEYRIVLPDGRTRYVAGRGEVISRQPDGAPHILINVVVDVTERAKAEERATEYTTDIAIAKTRFEALVRASAQIVWTAAASGEIAEDSPSWRQFTGQSRPEFLGSGWLDAVHPADRTNARSAWQAAVASSEPYSVEYRLRHADGGYLWTSSRGVPLLAGDGRVIEWVGMNEDISERVGREEHLRVVMRELSHRTKNLLAIIQSIARRTFMGEASTSRLVQLFVDRLHGIAVSHDLLINGNWHGVSLEDLISAHLRPFSTIDGSAIAIEGPPLLLRPEAAQQLGLALHELATNASKYGSLRTPAGRLRIAWRFRNDLDEPSLELVWTETTPALVLDPQTKKGFGSQLLDQIVSRSLGGKSVYRVGPDGVDWSLVTPVDRIVEADMSEYGPRLQPH